MSEVDGLYVKHGVWTNLDKGQIMGRTITTDTRTGIIIIAVVAVLSTIGTSHLWNLLVFAYHQARSTGRPTDGLFRQQQALLRTLPPSSSMMADSVKLWWSWRKRNKNVLRRSLAQFVLSTLCTVGFVAAGIFSSYVVSTSDLEVLVKSPLCGYLDRDSATSGNVWGTAVIAASSPYARECYRDQAILPIRCRTFIRPSIQFKTEAAPCPFSSDFCKDEKLDPIPAVAFDSGLVDLNDGFGTNFAPKDRVSYRRRTTCAILPLPGHISMVNMRDLPEKIFNRKAYPYEEALILHYGDRPKIGEWKNITTVISMLTSNITWSLYTDGHTYYPAFKEDYFLPLEGLRRNDSDTTVIALAASVRFANPVHDPWLLAQSAFSEADSRTGGNHTVYKPDSHLRSMGCTIQHQFCIKSASGDRCSKLAGQPDGILKMAEWQRASPVQLSALRLLSDALAIGFDSHTDLVASQYVRSQGLVADQIPSDQWIIEARAAESFVWATMQVIMADYAIGPGARQYSLINATMKPETDGDRILCKSFKMRKAGGFVNVNVFGLAFVIATSLFLTVVDFMLLKYLIYLGKFRKALSPRIDRWIQDGVLQLQRRAYEAQGQGTWSDLDKEVPLTQANDMLDDLPLMSVSMAKPTSPSTRPTSSGNPPSQQSTASTPPSLIQNHALPSQSTPPQTPPIQSRPIQTPPPQPSPPQTRHAPGTPSLTIVHHAI